MMEQYLKLMSRSLSSELKNYNVIDKSIPDITAETIKCLLRRGKCACGCDLSTNEECKLALEELLHYVPPESIGSQIASLKKDMGYYTESNEMTNRFDMRCDEYTRENTHLINYSNEARDLLREIGDQGADAKTISEKYTNCKKEYDESVEQLSRFKAQKINWDKVITEEEKIIERLSESEGINIELDEELRYVRALYLKAQEEYNKGSVEILEKMKETLQSVFKSMYHGKRSIELSNDYKISLSAEGSVLDASKGLETVKNFAFITTLLKVAQERANEDLELDAEPYPLVMDAVFSNTDEKHIKNICNELPKMAKQGILAIMDKDWNVAKETLSNNVGIIYRINKVSESKTYIEEVSINDS